MSTFDQQLICLGGADAGRTCSTSSDILCASTPLSTSDQSDVTSVIKDEKIGRAIASKGHHRLWAGKQSEEMASLDEAQGSSTSESFLPISRVILTDCRQIKHDDR